jgi:hypothetical protein
MNLSPLAYSRLKSRLQTRYKKNLTLIFKHLDIAENSRISEWMHEHHSYLKNYSAFNWYFLKQVHTFLFFVSEQEYLSDTVGAFSDDDDAVFEKWNQSEFAEGFLKLLNKGSSVSAANELSARALDQHLVTLGERQLLQMNSTSPHYRIQSSLGEIGTSKKPSKLLETTLHLEGKELVLKTKSLKEMKAFSSEIEKALKLIKQFSPTSWDRFKAFTEEIIPINQPELVSFSHQELPGVSMINLYHRDFVDLMDDLIHENGHHHLNHYLNLGHLIEEPQDLIYYSPWRRTLRPLRGIYHAYFTFYWAFRFFADLAATADLSNSWHSFTKDEVQKILWRAIEEYWMLDYSYQDLKIAHKRGLIHASGWELIEELQKELKKSKFQVPKWEARLKTHRKDLADLKKALTQARKKYALK